MTDSSTLYVDLTAATMIPGDEAYGQIQDAAIVVEDAQIAWVGPRGDLPSQYDSLRAHSLGGALSRRD